MTLVVVVIFMDIDGAGLTKGKTFLKIGQFDKSV
jgi:hypothetical protein